MNRAQTSAVLSRILLVGLLAFACAARTCAALPRYELKILKPLVTGPNTGSAAESINNYDVVVGSASVPTKPGYTGDRGVRWTTPTDVINMGFLLADNNGYTIVKALDVNSPGLAVGYAWGPGLDIYPKHENAVYWQPNASTPSRLPLLTGYGDIAYSAAIAVNDSGVITGTAGAISGAHALRWASTSGAPTTLADGLLGADVVHAFVGIDINNAGLIVGEGIKPGTTTDKLAMAWAPDGTPTVLQLPHGVPPEYAIAIAGGVNEHGAIVGQGLVHSANDDTFRLQGLKWTSISAPPVPLAFFELPIQDHFVRNNAVSINNQGIAVGSVLAYRDSNFVFRALAWDEAGSVYDLNSLVDNLGDWTLSDAADINHSGRIVGRAINSSGQVSAFLLVPVPEPSQMVNLFWLFAIVVRRRDRAS